MTSLCRSSNRRVRSKRSLAVERPARPPRPTQPVCVDAQRRPFSAPTHRQTVTRPSPVSTGRPHTAHVCQTVSVTTPASATDTHQDVSEHQRRRNMSPDRLPYAGQLY